MTRTGTCCCGNASITVENNPVLNGICHCNDCKRRTGSAFGWNAYFPTERVLDRSGDWTRYSPKAAPDQIRYACTGCASVMWWTTPFMPDAIGMPAGIFLETPLPEPDGTYQHSNHVSWFHVPAHWAQVS